VSTIIAFDFDGSGSLESAERSGTQTFVEKDGAVIWQHDGWIDGWNRQDADVFSLAVDVDGDGAQEILVRNDSDRWTGLFKWQGNALHTIWGSPSPIDGWNRGADDVFYAADVDGGGQQEIVVFDNIDRWTGVFKWQGNALHTIWASPSPIDGWNRGQDDQPTFVDLDADGCQEVVLMDPNDGWLGVLKWENGALHVAWASPSPLHGLVGNFDVHNCLTDSPTQYNGHPAVALMRPDNPEYNSPRTIATLLWSGNALEVVQIQNIPFGS
jgi:hypothetical protein